MRRIPSRASERCAVFLKVSYQWDVQPIVIRIVEALKQRGFAVWFDLEAMSGSTLDAMAEAIEGACCALVCMTAAYKNSANCRLEGNYIHNVGLPWVPLLLEEGYVATGCARLALCARCCCRACRVAGTLMDQSGRGRRAGHHAGEPAVLQGGLGGACG